MTRAEEFEALRPLLFSIAYRITGSVSDAEDAVQETWLRYDNSPAEVASTKSFLSRWSRASRSTCSVGSGAARGVRRGMAARALAQRPVPGAGARGGAADSVSMAALLLLERLSPLERAVFVLREVFRFDYPEIASAVGRSEAVPSARGACAPAHAGGPAPVHGRPA